MQEASTAPLTGLPPVIHGNDTILILGSFPSAASLERREYYGFPRNHFWRLIADLSGSERPTTYPEKLALLGRCRIALWDVIVSCHRAGSLDASIREEVPNPVPELLLRNPTIRHVYFNGLKAEETFWRFFRREAWREVTFTRLPSSSPVPGPHVTNYEEKRELWKTAFGGLPTRPD